MSTAKHSPLPWKIAHSPKFGDPFITTQKDYMVAGSVHGIDVHVAEANAALIVKSVNLLPELVAALEYIAGINGNLGTVDLENKCGPNDGLQRSLKLKSCIEIASELLARARQ